MKVSLAGSAELKAVEAACSAALITASLPFSAVSSALMATSAV